MSERLAFGSLVITAMALTAIPSMVTAQEAQARPAAAEITEVTVTARRREEKLQDVPLAVTAVDAATIERQGISGLSDVRRIAPSVNISQSAGGGRQVPLFTVRGQRQGDTLASVDPSVGIYIGDVLFKRAYGLDQISFDMKSIEVLKGPQGTLFGLNVTGGNIIFRPNLPTNEFSSSVLLGTGNFGDRHFGGYLNLPLAQGAALRIAGEYRQRSGYITNVATGQDNQDLDGGGLRVSLKLDPSDTLSSLFVGSYLKSNTNGTGWHLNFLQPTNEAGTVPTSIFGPTGPGRAALNAALAQSNAIGFYQTAQETPNFAKTDPAWNIANTTAYHLSNAVTLKNIVGYRKYSTIYFEDVDGSSLRFLEYGNTQNGHEVSEELQILGEAGRLNWIAGAYYFQEQVDAFAYNTGLISPKLDGLKPPYKNAEIVQNTSKSLFVSGTQKLDSILEGLSFTLGGRYTWDTRDATFGTIDRVGYAPGQLTGLGTKSAGQGCSFNPVADPAILSPAYHFDPTTCFVSLSKDYSQLTYTASLDWKIRPNALIYLAHRKGYRAGGFGTRATAANQLTPFAPESVKDIELGAKLDFRFDNGVFLRTNIAAYHQDYNDIQRLVPFVAAGGGVSTNVLNAAKATIDGFELETTFVPAAWLELSGYVSNVEPKYKRFISAGVDVSQQAAFAGTPHWQVSTSARFMLPLGPSVGEAAFQLSYYHQSSFSIQDSTDFQPAGQTPGYGLLNGRLELNEIGGKPLDADIFVNNITDRHYSIANYALQYSFGFASYLAGPPRMYGLELRYSFGKK
jgi:iron complex outermembrane receptor protein